MPWAPRRRERHARKDVGGAKSPSSARTLAENCCRCRTVSETRSRSRPGCRRLHAEWRRHGSRTRSSASRVVAISVSASSTGRPRSVSRSTRPNSLLAGSSPVTTACIDCRKDVPDVPRPPSSAGAPRCSSKACWRFVPFEWRMKIGRPAPTGTASAEHARRAGKREQEGGDEAGAKDDVEELGWAHRPASARSRAAEISPQTRTLPKTRSVTSKSGAKLRAVPEALSSRRPRGHAAPAACAAGLRFAHAARPGPRRIRARRRTRWRGSRLPSPVGHGTSRSSAKKLADRGDRG